MRAYFYFNFLLHEDVNMAQETILTKERLGYYDTKLKAWVTDAVQTSVDGVAEDVANHESRLAAIESVEYVEASQEEIMNLFA